MSSHISYRMTMFLLLIGVVVSACSPAQASIPANRAGPSTPTHNEAQARLPTATAIYPSYLPLVTKPEAASQTINGVSTVIDWAYADESRVSIRYTVSGLDWPDHVMMAPDLNARLSSRAIPNLMMGAVSWHNSPVDAGTISGGIDQMLPAHAVDLSRTPQVDIEVDIPVDGRGASLFVPPTGDQQIQQSIPVELPNVGSFHFELELPIYQAIRVTDINQTVEANSVRMTLKEVILNRSHADALLCFQMPSQEDWQLTTAKLQIGKGPELAYSGSSLMPMDFGKGSNAVSDAERCSTVGFDVSYDGKPTTVQIRIPMLITSVPEIINGERVRLANQKLADRGIGFDYSNQDHGGNIVLLKKPADMPENEIYMRIWEAMADWYEGPWIFNVKVEP